MGIYDREYYRNEGPSFLGSITSTPQVCKWLIIINVAVFLVQILEPGWFTHAFALIAGPGYGPNAERRGAELGPGVFQGQVWRLLTYAFLHSPMDLFHILWNMLFLWWFGSELEQQYGSKEFLAFYLLSAVLGGVAFVAAQLAGVGQFGYCVGASGAVTAVLVLFALHYPRHTILLFFVVPVPIWLFVAYSVAKDSFVFLSGVQTGTAVTVHLGGAIFGLAYYKFQLRLLDLLPDFRSWRARRSRPKLRVYREEEPVAAPVPRTSPSDLDEHLEAKLDAVLEKVQKHGKSSLTEGENQILLRASELYKRKRS